MPIHIKMDRMVVRSAIKIFKDIIAFSLPFTVRDKVKDSKFFSHNMRSLRIHSRNILGESLVVYFVRRREFVRVFRVYWLLTLLNSSSNRLDFRNPVTF